MRRWPTLLIFVSTAITTQKKIIDKVLSSYTFNLESEIEMKITKRKRLSVRKAF